MSRRQRLDLALCGAAGTFYLLNFGLLRETIEGWAGWFLKCYANDGFAGLAMVAWLDLLLDLGRLPSVRSWKVIVPFLLACGLVWEYVAPIWKPEAVADPWDLLAYQVGGALYWGIKRHWRNKATA